MLLNLKKKTNIYLFEKLFPIKSYVSCFPIRHFLIGKQSLGISLKSYFIWKTVNVYFLSNDLLDNFIFKSHPFRLYPDVYEKFNKMDYYNMGTLLTPSHSNGYNK